MTTSIDKKAARFGRYGLGIPKNIRKGTDKYLELKSRAIRRLGLVLARESKELSKDLVKDKVKPALDEAGADLRHIFHGFWGKPTGHDNYTASLIKKYRKSFILRPWRAALLRKRLVLRRKQRERWIPIHKKYTILDAMHRASSILLVADIAHKHGYGIYADVMPIWYEHVLQREMPAIVRKKMLLLQKGHKINLNPSDFGNTVVFSRQLPGGPLLRRRNVYTKTIANNADPFVPGMLYGTENDYGLSAFLRGRDVLVSPHRDIALGYAGDPERPYMIALNPEALAVAGYRSDGKPLLTPHIADKIRDLKIRSAILRGTYNKSRIAGRSIWGDRPDYLAVAYLKPLREGVENWRNTGLFRVFSKSKDSDTGWLLILPTITQDKYEHLRRFLRW